MLSDRRWRKCRLKKRINFKGDHTIEVEPSHEKMGLSAVGFVIYVVYVLIVHVYFAGVEFCLSSLPLGVGGWMRLVIVALPGRFYKLFFSNAYAQPRNKVVLLSLELILILYEPPHDKTNKMACTPSEDSDQPGYSPSLIRVFAVRSMGG